MVAKNQPFVVEKCRRGAERRESIREGFNLLNGWMRALGRRGMRERGRVRWKGFGCEWGIRARGTQDDDNCRKTVVVRNVACACAFQIEIVIVCSFEPRGLSERGGRLSGRVDECVD